MTKLLVRWWNARQVRQWERSLEKNAMRDQRGRDHLGRQRAGIRDSFHIGF